ncbi:MAG: rod shape-determining protein RodA [Bacteroidales bacterium]
MKRQLSLYKNIDKTVVILFLIMVLMGWFNIFSAEISETNRSIFDLSQSYGKQLIWIITALLLAATVLMIDVKFYPTFSYLIYGLMALVLIGVLFFGTEINASRSWFRIGGFAIQPAEFAKYATALALAKYTGDLKTKTPGWNQRLKAFAIIGFPMVLVLLQNDMGTALVFTSLLLALYRSAYVGSTLLIVGSTGVVLFVLTLLVNELIIIGALAAITLVAAIVIRKKRTELIQLIGLFILLSVYVYSVDYAFENVLQPHQKLRIEVLIDEEVDLRGAGYNLHQSKIAIGSGGFWGKGYLRGTQTKFNFVPEQGTDFIFCTIGEEWGFAGSTVIIILFIWLLVRLTNMAERQRSTFSRVYGYAVVSIMFFHFAINIGMTIGLFPVIGIPLPFFSYGGSSLWGFTIMLFTFLKLDSRRLDLL